MRPSQVLDCHADLLDRLGEWRFRGSVAALIEAEMFGRGMSKEEFKPMAEMMVDTLHRHVAAAHVFRVTEDMVDLVDFAAAGLDDEDAWDPSLAPTGCGIVRWDKPVLMAEAADVQMYADWAVWGPGPEGRTAIWWFADPYTRPDDSFLGLLTAQGYKADTVRSVVGRWSFVAWDMFRPGMTMGPPRMPLDPQVAEAYVKNRTSSSAVAELLAHEYEAGNVVQSNDARTMHALWLLLGQTITTLQEEKIDRSARRRAIRKNLPPRVTTIALRRTEHRPAEGETHVEWKHRWIVRGHWRWQACGAGRKERKRIWVHPHVKGPEGMPLKQSEKIYDLRR